MRFLKKFFRNFSRDWKRMWGMSESFERLARRKAYRLNGAQFEILSIHLEAGGCFLKVKGPIDSIDSFAIIWLDHSIDVQPGGKVTVRYVPEAQRELVRVYGSFGYRSHQTTYLTV